MGINVMYATRERYQDEVYTYALLANESKVNEIAEQYQNLWENGSGFTFSTMFEGRKEDSEEQLNACTQQIRNYLEEIVKRNFVYQYSRDEIVSLLNLLFRGPLRNYRQVEICGGLKVNLDEITMGWNDAHPEEKPIRTPCEDFFV